MSAPANPMPRGAIPTPPSVIAAANRYTPAVELGAPQSYLSWPSHMSYWGNDTYGDCVSAEEAFAKIVTKPMIFISDTALVAWAKQYGYLNGARLPDVMTTMNTEGIQISGGVLKDGSHSLVQYTDSATAHPPLLKPPDGSSYSSVQYTDSAALQSAISSYCPVKLGVAAGSFEDNENGHVTHGESGWAMFNYPSGLTEDHCVGLCGYGILSDLVGLFETAGVKVKLPINMPQGMCYAFFTWNSIGIVDEQSLLNMTYEAWVRTPVTRLSGFPSVSALKLHNDGGFRCDIHALYRSQDDAKYSDAANGHNFPLGQRRTMTLSDKCTNPPILAGDIVQLKVWVQWGDDNTYRGLFIYDPDGPIQSFKISGGTHNNSIQYQGPVPSS